MIGALMQSSGLSKSAQAILTSKKDGSIKSEDALTAMAGLLSLAKPDFAAIEQFRNDEYFMMCLGLSKVPSEPTLRQRLDEIASDTAEVQKVIIEAGVNLIQKHAPALSPCFKEYIAIDADVSPFDNSGSKKEGVSCTYKLMNGYAPMFAYIGNEGYMLNAELREGKQHCQKGTPEFLSETIRLARKITDKPFIVRLDSGNDDAENVKIFRKEKVDYIIKKNIRRESVEEWLLEARAFGQWHTHREGKRMYVGDTTRDFHGKPERIVFEVIERTITAEGQVLLIPEVEVNTWRTSLKPKEASPEDVIALYKDHGTSEQYHSELKSDMDLERLPSGKFATNALILALAAPVFNMLRLCGQVGMSKGFLPRKKVVRRRIRTVIQDMMYMAARVVKHAHRIWLYFSVRNPLRGSWTKTYLAFTGTG
jgi:hypothetical protein